MEEIEMFEKLIESDSKGAEFKNRGRYFMISSVVVGILFITAVVFSLYAQDLNLGGRDFELVELIAPLTPETPEGLQPRQIKLIPSQNQSEPPSRQANIARIDEVQPSPSSVSVTPNALRERPIGRFVIGRGPELDGPGTSGSSVHRNGGPQGTGSGDTIPAIAAVMISLPPVIKPVEKPRKNIIISDGVINGKATYLPKPLYSATARAVGAAGNVDVQVTIDETGRVISAKAVNGHPFLKTEAEKSAWKAKFSPTYLSKVPVKVTGVIVYKFASIKFLNF